MKWSKLWKQLILCSIITRAVWFIIKFLLNSIVRLQIVVSRCSSTSWFYNFHGDRDLQRVVSRRYSTSSSREEEGIWKVILFKVNTLSPAMSREMSDEVCYRRCVNQLEMYFLYDRFWSHKFQSWNIWTVLKALVFFSKLFPSFFQMPSFSLGQLTRLKSYDDVSTLNIHNEISWRIKEPPWPTISLSLSFARWHINFSMSKRKLK
jgi:hypothetical protein